MAQDWVIWAGALVLGYLFGAIPFGLLLTRAAGVGDIRAIGSGNIGATNVLRTGRKGLAAGTLLLDGLKGTIAVWIASRWGLAPALVAALGAFLGHCFPLWLRFKGGKGVATFFGILLGLHWPTMIVSALVWIGAAAATRYSSLAALLATASAPLLLVIVGQRATAILVLVLTIIVWIRHRANLSRLLAGEESRIGQA